MYVLTEGWYDDKEVVGVVSNETAARAWADSGDTRSYYGPFEEGFPA